MFSIAVWSVSIGFKLLLDPKKGLKGMKEFGEKFQKV